MANRYARNQEIIKEAPNYHKIIESDIFQNDQMSAKIVEIYIRYIFSIKILNDNSKKRINKLDKIIYKYFTDFDFKKELVKGLLNIKVKKDEENVFEGIVNGLFEIYDRYLESYTRNIYIPKWI